MERDITPAELFGLVADDINATYADGDTETMSLEEARAMLHKTV